MIRRNQFEKDQLKKAIGEPIWKQLQERNITTIEEFSHLTDQSLEEIAANASPPGASEDLKILCKKAKKFGNLQWCVESAQKMKEFFIENFNVISKKECRENIKGTS